MPDAAPEPAKPDAVPGNYDYEAEFEFQFFDESAHAEVEFTFGAITQKCLRWSGGGASVWTGSHAFGEFIAREGGVIFAGPGVGRVRVVELGSGHGLMGLLAAHFATEVVITDGDRQEVLLLEQNAERYAPVGKGKVTAAHLAWGFEAGERSTLERGSADVIIAAEVAYTPHQIPLLVESMAYLLAPGGAVFLCNCCVSVSSTQEECAAVLHEALRGRGLTWQELPYEEYHVAEVQGPPASTSYLLRISRAPPPPPEDIPGPAATS